MTHTDRLRHASEPTVTNGTENGVAVGSIFWCFVDSIQIGAHDAGSSAIQN